MGQEFIKGCQTQTQHDVGFAALLLFCLHEVTGCLLAHFELNRDPRQEHSVRKPFLTKSLDLELSSIDLCDGQQWGVADVQDFTRFDRSFSRRISCAR